MSTGGKVNSHPVDNHPHKNTRDPGSPSHSARDPLRDQHPLHPPQKEVGVHQQGRVLDISTSQGDYIKRY